MSQAEPTIIITICSTCRQPGVAREDAPGRALFAAVSALGADAPGVEVRRTQCLSVCKRVCTAAISGEGRYTFLFGDLEPAADAAALLELARACQASAHGFVPWKERPETLRAKIIARVPPPGWSPEDGGAPA